MSSLLVRSDRPDTVPSTGDPSGATWSNRVSEVANAGRPIVLVLIKHFEPAYRFGGPIQSVANIVSALQDEFDFRVLCLDRDFREESRLPGIQEGVWIERNGARVSYLDVSLLRPLKLVRWLRNTDYDVLYLNSFFEPLFSTLPAMLTRLGVLPARPIIMAPRGEFAAGALRVKSVKKRAFGPVQRLLRLYEGAFWQASSEDECQQIKTFVGGKARIRLAPDIPSKRLPQGGQRPPKKAGACKIAYVSRIAPVKNLRGLVEALSMVQGKIELDVWGPVDDEAYWCECLRAIHALPTNIVAKYRGSASRDQVRAIFESSHAMTLLTWGESYGHVINEALSSGCPVLIGDKTPWCGLSAAGVGWDVPADDVASVVKALQRLVEMDGDAYREFDGRCKSFAARRAATLMAEDQTRNLFREAADVSL